MTFQIKTLEIIRRTLISFLAECGYSISTDYTLSLSQTDKSSFTLHIVDRNRKSLGTEIKKALDGKYASKAVVTLRHEILCLDVQQWYIQLEPGKLFVPPNASPVLPATELPISIEEAKEVAPLPLLLEAKLSKREIEITKLICDEFTSKEIAVKLQVAKKTIEVHRTNIFKKIDKKNIVGLVKYAIRHGIYSLSVA